jgi:hypothetical protein
MWPPLNTPEGVLRAMLARLEQQTAAETGAER